MTVIDEIRTIQRLVKKIEPLLHGHDPGIQGAVLADLLATWLAGHQCSSPLLRDELLDMHIKTVRRLVPINARERNLS